MYRTILREDRKTCIVNGIPLKLTSEIGIYDNYFFLGLYSILTLDDLFKIVPKSNRVSSFKSCGGQIYNEIEGY